MIGCEFELGSVTQARAVMACEMVAAQAVGDTLQGVRSRDSVGVSTMGDVVGADVPCGDDIPHTDVTIDPSHLFSGAREVLSHIRPAWHPDDIIFKLFTNGTTNKLLHCSLKSAPEQVVLVRVYGHNTDLLIDRKAEIRNIKLLQKVGFSPHLYATFNNGLVYEFAPGETLTSQTVRADHIFPLVARKMAALHRIELPPPVPDQEGPRRRRPVLWDILRKYLSLLPRQFIDPEKQRRFVRMCGSISSLHDELDDLEQHLSVLGSPVVMCHNDLLLANVIFDSDTDKVVFIDYEYAGINYQAFDIGNHFAEFAGMSTVDYSLYPDKKFQQQWLRIYLEEMKRDSSTVISEADVENLYVQVNKFALASHFLWGIWALVQSVHSAIDFDFFQYGEIRLKEYYTRKQELFSLSEQNS